MPWRAQGETLQVESAAPGETAGLAASEASAGSASRRSCMRLGSRQTTGTPRSHQEKAVHGAAPLLRCVRSGTGVHMDKIQQSGMCGTAPSCTWGGVASCAVRAFHAQIDTYRHICIHRLLRKVCRVLSCICLWLVGVARVRWWCARAGGVRDDRVARRGLGELARKQRELALDAAPN